MIKAEVDTQNGKKGVSVIIRGDTDELYNELRALYHKFLNNDDLYKIAYNAMESVKMGLIIQKYKENK